MLLYQVGTLDGGLVRRELDEAVVTGRLGNRARAATGEQLASYCDTGTATRDGVDVSVCMRQDRVYHPWQSQTRQSVWQSTLSGTHC